MKEAAYTVPPVRIIKPRTGWQGVDFKELKEYRDLFFFLVWRDVKVMYAQTILGFSWAILQPLIQIVLFTIVFGKVAKVYTDGIPYVLFSSVAIVPWTYMSQAMTKASESLVSQQSMLGKIYFPRVIFPMTPVLAHLIDFFIAFFVLGGVLAYYHVYPSWNWLLLPFLVAMMMCIPTAIGMWLSALAIRFRDVRHAMQFMQRMLIYSAPIVYSASHIPEGYRFLYSLNPIVGVVEGFRACLLNQPIPWLYVLPGVVTVLLLLGSGVLYFRRMERIFADVI
jgi:lipopolysaccharide transport system permease protein